MLMLRSRPPTAARRKERLRARSQSRGDIRNGHVARTEHGQARGTNSSRSLLFKVLTVVAMVLFIIGIVLILLRSGQYPGVNGGQIAGILLVLASIGIVAGMIAYCVYNKFKKEPASQGVKSQSGGHQLNSVSRQVEYPPHPGAAVNANPNSSQDIFLEFGQRGTTSRNPGTLGQLPDIRISHELDGTNGHDPDLHEITFDIDTEEGMNEKVPPIDLSGVEPSPPTPKKSFENPAYDSGDEEVPADYNAPPESSDHYTVPPDYDDAKQDPLENPANVGDNLGQPEGQSQSIPEQGDSDEKSIGKSVIQSADTEPFSKNDAVAVQISQDNEAQ